VRTFFRQGGFSEAKSDRIFEIYGVSARTKGSIFRDFMRTATNRKLKNIEHWNLFSTKKRRPGLLLRIPSADSAVQEVPTGQEYDGSSTASSGFENDAITPLEDIHILPSIGNASVETEGIIIMLFNWSLKIEDTTS